LLQLSSLPLHTSVEGWHVTQALFVHPSGQGITFSHWPLVLQRWRVLPEQRGAPGRQLWQVFPVQPLPPQLSTISVPLPEQLIRWPLRQKGALLGLQSRQVPPTHTRLPPHPVPSLTFPATTHREAPVLQEIVPRLQGSPVLQVAPSSHATQLPFPHTRLLPQLLPLGALPVSMQREAPVAQVVVPTLQADGSQALLGAQGIQVPLLQT
jgi:hypothetical protein